MDRVERAGLGIALAGHAALVALLSLRLAVPPPSVERPIAVSLVEDVAATQAAPPAPEPPSASSAPEQGAPEEAAPPAPASPPVPAPPAARPEPAAKPPPPETKSAPPARAAAKPAPVAKPPPRPAAGAKALATPVPAADVARPNADRLASVIADAERAAAARPGGGGAGTAARARGSRLGSDFLKGLSDAPSRAAPSAAAPGATMSAKAAADIGSAIRRQVQPCADRQVNPGPGAEQIRVTINLRLNRDGSLAAAPRIVGHDGVDDANRRYLARVDDLAIATFSGCSPLRGLPADLYQVAGGWRSFTLRYKLPG